MATDSQKRKAFEDALKAVSSNFKHETVELLGDKKQSEVPTLSTGSLALDSILGGGVARGRIVEIYGAEASGKTSIAMTMIANIQKEGGHGVLIDCEQAADLNYFAKLGVDTKTLGFTQAIIAEDVLKMVHDLCETGAVDIIVVDSVASMIPRAEFTEETFDKASIGVIARLMSKALRKIAVAANKNNCTVVFLNQTRANVGVMYGPSTTTTGGVALKFYASQRIEVKRKGKVEEDGNVIGNEVFMRCVKNKIGVPYGECISVLTYAKGINQAAELLTLGEKMGIIQKEGRTYYCNIPTDVDISGGSAERVKADEEKVKIAVNIKPTTAEIETNEKLFKALSLQLEESVSKSIGTGAGNE